MLAPHRLEQVGLRRADEPLEAHVEGLEVAERQLEGARVLDELVAELTRRARHLLHELLRRAPRGARELLEQLPLLERRQQRLVRVPAAKLAHVLQMQRLRRALAVGVGAQAREDRVGDQLAHRRQRLDPLGGCPRVRLRLRLLALALALAPALVFVLRVRTRLVHRRLCRGVVESDPRCSTRLCGRTHAGRCLRSGGRRLRHRRFELEQVCPVRRPRPRGRALLGRALHRRLRFGARRPRHLDHVGLIGGGARRIRRLLQLRQRSRARPHHHRMRGRVVRSCRGRLGCGRHGRRLRCNDTVLHGHRTRGRHRRHRRFASRRHLPRRRLRLSRRMGPPGLSRRELLLEARRLPRGRRHRDATRALLRLERLARRLRREQQPPHLLVALLTRRRRLRLRRHGRRLCRLRPRLRLRQPSLQLGSARRRRCRRRRRRRVAHTPRRPSLRLLARRRRLSHR